MVKPGIKPENLYGMDETGCPPSNQGTECVVGQRSVKTQHLQEGAACENVTALITICADSTVLRPTIIFKAKKTSGPIGETTMFQRHRKYRTQYHFHTKIKAKYIF